MKILKFSIIFLNLFSSSFAKYEIYLDRLEDTSGDLPNPPFDASNARIKKFNRTQ
jgi:hypothetical protein